ncbi:MAG: spermine synthase [Chloroflexi bacterium]|nr:MAG: spermine synthase [Anaerolineaceae bacterium 4572_32.2]RLC72380.1 MAG: spermine synthase [Chloroflexota bacterium]RLC76742.1 MAG: spermine synthase [Chloroflexota bacterium]HEY74545.1 methyltransferase domain-containing protein [Thermoflexia bacterium]
MTNEQIVLSRIQAESVLEAHRAGEAWATVSLDLGLTTAEAAIESNGIRLPDGQALTWKQLGKIAKSKRGCFVIENNRPRKIQSFSKAANRLYSLMPTTGAPTMLLSGVAMHRIKGIDPHRDTLRKIETITPIVGRVLDTATGLGYTTIEAARTAEQVTTIEIEPAALEVARLNPWSRALFENPNITQIVGDSFDEIETFEEETFARIIHDPPAFALGGDLYSSAFYHQLFRVLQRGGRLFHYIGDLESKSGRTVARGAIRRLREAGFSRVARRPGAFGLVVYK